MVAIVNAVFRRYPSVNREPGLVRRWQVSDAVCHDSRVFARVPDESSSSGTVRADSACHSRSHEALLAEGGSRSRIPCKGDRNPPLSTRSREASRKRSKVQAAVGHVLAQPGPWAASWPGLSSWIGRISRRVAGAAGYLGGVSQPPVVGMIPRGQPQALEGAGGGGACVGPTRAMGGKLARTVVLARAHFREGGGRSRIPRKGYRNRPLSAWSQEASRKRSKGAAVEHVC